MAVRPRQQDAVERILAASVELFLQHGVQGTNMDSIAAQAHSSKQTIYAHFEDKDAILEETLNRVAMEFAELHLPIDMQDPDFQAQLARLAFAYLKHVTHDRTVSMLRLCVESTRRTGDTSVVSRFVPFHETRFQLAQYMRHLMDTGKIVPDDADAVTQDFIGLVVGDTLRQRVLDSTYTINENELMQRAERAARLFCRAMRAE